MKERYLWREGTVGKSAGAAHLHADDAGRPEHLGLGDPVERARQQIQCKHHLGTRGRRVVDGGV